METNVPAASPLDSQVMPKPTTQPQAFFSDEVLLRAMLEPWEESMAANGICPKCSDSLSRTSEGGGVRFSQCMGCGNIFVLKA